MQKQFSGARHRCAAIYCSSVGVARPKLRKPRQAQHDISPAGRFRDFWPGASALQESGSRRLTSGCYCSSAKPGAIISAAGVDDGSDQTTSV